MVLQVMSLAARSPKGSLPKGSIGTDSRKDTDTIRLWENYREQAHMWRALSLLQIPATLIALLFALWIWNTRSITLNVPPRPLPGIYDTNEIPDAEYIESATGLVNLIATYQPAVARRQFIKAREMLKEPLLTKFDSEMMGLELSAIEGTSRTQVYYVDPTKTKVERRQGEVIVSLVGERMKLIAGKELPVVTTKYSILLSTLPRNELNPFGLAVSNIGVENIEK